MDMQFVIAKTPDELLDLLKEEEIPGFEVNVMSITSHTGRLVCFFYLKQKKGKAEK